METNLSWYDTAETLGLHVLSLAMLRCLAEERRVAATQRHEPLSSFLVLGRFLFHANGSLQLAVTDKACTTESVQTVAAAESKPARYFAFPGEGTRCPLCLRRWTLANCHESAHRYSYARVALTAYVGQRFATAWRDIGSNPEHLCLEPLVVEIGEDDPLVFLQGQAPDPSYIIDGNDELCFLKGSFFCRDCLRIQERDSVLALYLHAVEEAGGGTGTAAVVGEDLDRVVVRTHAGATVIFAWHGGELRVQVGNGSCTNIAYQSTASLIEATEYLRTVFSL